MTTAGPHGQDLVDRDAEAHLLGCVFTATIALDLVPGHDGARQVIEEFGRFDVTWISSRDLARVAAAMQVVLRDEGVPVPLAVRDELRRRGHVEEVRALPMLVTRSAAVISGWGYYRARVGEVCARRRQYLSHLDAATELLEGQP